MLLLLVPCCASTINHVSSRQTGGRKLKLIAEPRDSTMRRYSSVLDNMLFPQRNGFLTSCSIANMNSYPRVSCSRYKKQR